MNKFLKSESDENYVAYAVEQYKKQGRKLDALKVIISAANNSWTVTLSESIGSSFYHMLTRNTDNLGKAYQLARLTSKAAGNCEIINRLK